MSEPTLNQLWASAIIGELKEAGVRQVVVSPGSRSTPLALAVATDAEIAAYVVIDERSAGFFALGIAKATNQPVALICTSGSAAANFFPAIVEAQQGHVPLMVLTADRPWELQNFSAPQTMPQGNLYGHMVKKCALLSTPNASEQSLAQLRAEVGRTAIDCLTQPRGVAHFNVPFAEPLSPAPNASFPVNVSNAARLFPPVIRAPVEQLSLLAKKLNSSGNGVVIVGPMPDRPESKTIKQIRALAQKLQYPIFSEAASNMRFGFEEAVNSYDSLLRHAPFTVDFRPDIVLRFGGGLTLKTLQRWVDECQSEIISFSDNGDLVDPHHRTKEFVQGEVSFSCEQLLNGLNAAPASRVVWRKSLSRCEEKVQGSWKDLRKQWNEPAIAAAVVKALPEDSNLFLASSMPIRDVDSFAVTERHVHVFCNRAVNGIDGNISTALGISAATRKHTVALVGDVATLHDIGSMITARRADVPLTLVVVNNDGGSIFSFLPVAQHKEHFERLFGTPHGMNFQSYAQLGNAHYKAVRSIEELQLALASAFEHKGLNVIEAVTQRSANVENHQKFHQAAADALGPNPWISP